jgi:lipopolysaccharide transport system ATP-binding protein
VIEKYIVNSNNTDQNIYVFDENKSGKKVNYFNRIFTKNAQDKIASDFSFDEKVKLEFEFTIRNLTPNLLIGIGLQDKLQNRVCTILKPVSFFKNDGSKYHGKVELPSSTIAPNIYSFVFVIWEKDIQVYDSVENVCPIKIHDNGTELAVYEGMDYGNVIITPNWSNV